MRALERRLEQARGERGRGVGPVSSSPSSSMYYGGGGSIHVALVALASALAGAKLQDVARALLERRGVQHKTSHGSTRAAPPARTSRREAAASLSSMDDDDDDDRVGVVRVDATAVETPSQTPSTTPSRPPLKALTRMTLGSPPPLAQDAENRGPDRMNGGGGLMLCRACNENAVPAGALCDAGEGFEIRAVPRYSVAKKPDPFLKTGRSKYLSWDDYFMSVAFLSAQRSKDPNKQVGAVIVGSDRVILGVGYNGFPRGCADHDLPWAKKSAKGDPLETKYAYVCHAEMNAIMNKNSQSLAGATLYVTMYPCNECAKLVIQSGIKEVVYFEGKCTTPPLEMDAAAPPTTPQRAVDRVEGRSGGGTNTSGGEGAGESEGGRGKARGQWDQAATALVDGDTAKGGAGAAAQSYSSPTKGGMQADPTYAAAQRLFKLANLVVRQHTPSATVDVTYD